MLALVLGGCFKLRLGCGFLWWGRFADGVGHVADVWCLAVSRGDKVAGRWGCSGVSVELRMGDAAASVWHLCGPQSCMELGHLW